MAPTNRLYIAIRSLIQRIFPHKVVSEVSHSGTREYEIREGRKLDTFDSGGSKAVSPIARAAAPSPVRPLRDPVILYVDDSRESREATKLLQSSGISPFVTDGPVEPFDRKPLVIFNGGVYRGIDEIQDLVDLLTFWSNQNPLIQRSVFKDHV